MSNYLWNTVLDLYLLKNKDTFLLSRRYRLLFSGTKMSVSDKVVKQHSIQIHF